MTFLEILGQIIGIILSAVSIITAQFPKRWQILLGNVFVNLLTAINLPLIGAGLAVSAQCIVAASHCAFNIYKDRKGLSTTLAEKIIFCFLYPGAWGLGFYVSYVNGSASPYDVVPLVASTFFLVSVFLRKENHMRLCLLGTASLDVLYDILIPNTAIIAHSFTTISILIAIYRYRKQKPIIIDTKNDNN